MEVRVEFRCPNAIINASEELTEPEYDRLLDIAPSWTMYGEIVVIEFDLETGTARIVPPSSIPGA
jgi:hypothetical protein